MSREEFEEIVTEGIAAIPEKFLKKLKNVAIVIEDEPTPVQKEKLKLRPREDILGLYEGVSQLRRGASYTAVLPDKITIFKKAIEEVSRNEEEIKEMVKNTVWHEIAHHFGMDEVEVRQAEAKRRKIENN